MLSLVSEYLPCEELLMDLALLLVDLAFLLELALGSWAWILNPSCTTLKPWTAYLISELKVVHLWSKDGTRQVCVNLRYRSCWLIRKQSLTALKMAARMKYATIRPIF